MEPETVLTVPKDGGDNRRDGKEDGTRKRKRNMKQQGTVPTEDSLGRVIERVEQS